MTTKKQFEQVAHENGFDPRYDGKKRIMNLYPKGDYDGDKTNVLMLMKNVCRFELNIHNHKYGKD